MKGARQWNRATPATISLCVPKVDAKLLTNSFPNGLLTPGRIRSEETINGYHSAVTVAFAQINDVSLALGKKWSRFAEVRLFESRPRHRPTILLFGCLVITDRSAKPMTTQRRFVLGCQMFDCIHSLRATAWPS